MKFLSAMCRNAQPPSVTARFFLMALDRHLGNLTSSLGKAARQRCHLHATRQKGTVLETSLELPCPLEASPAVFGYLFVSCSLESVFKKYHS